MYTSPGFSGDSVEKYALNERGLKPATTFAINVASECSRGLQPAFMANRYQRGATYEKTHTGTGIEDPNIDFAMLARSMGLYGEGPISDPKDLGPALRRAVERVERGEVALLDVVTQPR